MFVHSGNKQEISLNPELLKVFPNVRDIDISMRRNIGGLFFSLTNILSVIQDTSIGSAAITWEDEVEMSEKIQNQIKQHYGDNGYVIDFHYYRIGRKNDTYVYTAKIKTVI